MRKLTLGLMAVALVALAAPALAPAGTNKLTGKIKGDADSKVKAKVVVEDRVPVRVEGLKFRKVDFRCPSGQILRGSVDASSVLRVQKNGKFVSESRDIEIDGRVKRRGRKIVGDLTAKLDFDGERCVAKGQFKAR